MLNHILAFEIRRRMTKPSTYVHFLIFAMLGFLGMWRASVGKGLYSRLTLAGQGNIEADAPYALYYYITLLTTFGLLIAMSWFANAASRDFKYKSQHLFFSYPIGESSYLLGRFGGALVGMLFVVSGIGMGALAAAASPVVDSSGIGSIHVLAFVHPYLMSVLPNMLMAGALFFSITILSRQYSAVWAGMAAIVVLHFVAIGLARAEYRLLAALLDPSGLVASRLTYAYWSIAQKNEMLMPLSGLMLVNRLVWLGVTVAIFGFTYQRFSFLVPSVKSDRNAHTLPEIGNQSRALEVAFCAIRNFSFSTRLRQFLGLLIDDFRHLVLRKSFYFVVALGLGLVFAIGYNSIGIVRGTQTFPITSQVLAALCENLYFLGVLVAMYCSSALIWRQRDVQLNEIFDTLPVPRWVPLLSKIGAMAMVQAIMMALVLVGGIIIQITFGFYNFELGLYLTELLGVQLVYYVLVSVFALFAQVLFGKKSLGFVVTLLFIDEFMAMIGLNHKLWTFAARPTHIYSDMNGYGPFGAAIAAYNIYWIFFCVGLVLLTMLIYPRGLDTGIRQRFLAVRGKISRPVIVLAIAGVCGCLAVGGFIIYNTVILNTFETENRSQQYQAEYEKTYKSWEKKAQAHITGIKAEVDLFPAQRRVDVRGQMLLTNETSTAIDTLFIQLPHNAQINNLSFSTSAELVHAGPAHGVYLYDLQKPMMPDEVLELKFDLGFIEHGFTDTNANTRLVKNGTFLTVVHLFPASGYNPYCSSEIQNNDQREKFGLPLADRLPPADDQDALMTTMLGNHADWIDFELTVSTSADQIAIAPGDLIRQWDSDGRRYFHYQAPDKILRYFAILSARYEVKRDHYGDIGINIYYHPEHNYNIDLMIDSVKSSLAYFTREFGPYQFSTIKIVEFPRYELFAEAFPGVIPFSEGYGFIAKYDETRVKEAYRVVAHEVGHQWWAHQVIGGNVEGAFVLTEVMAQYSALMVSRANYDQSQIDAYICLETDRYLRGRSRETENEVPLIRTNQATWYEHYAKGFVVMNSLVEYIGEDKINSAIRSFINETAFQEPPFTTSNQLVDHFRAVTPDSMLYLIEDCFDRIVLFDNVALGAECDIDAQGRIQVTLSFEAQKWVVDGQGKETAEPLHDLLEFAVFDAAGEELCRHRQWVDDQTNKITMFVDQVPARAGIDPHYLLVDKQIDNNLVDIEMK